MENVTELQVATDLVFRRHVRRRIDAGADSETTRDRAMNFKLMPGGRGGSLNLTQFTEPARLRAWKPPPSHESGRRRAAPGPGRRATVALAIRR